jgi:hypothetical protein
MANRTPVRRFSLSVGGFSLAVSMVARRTNGRPTIDDRPLAAEGTGR